jgi:AmmeMemoRadiSam system protein A
MPSPEPVASLLTALQRDTLLTTALASIRHGVDTGAALEVNPEQYDQPLREQRACFVTLHRNADLRGCIGHLEAVQPLIQDVAENAFAAAFKDPRFAPLEEQEMEGLDIHISVLTPPRPLLFSSEQELLSRMQPGIDGLILEDGSHRGTFLPSVWDSLPDPESFLRHLKMKAGLPQNYWSDTVTIYRYETESFPA